MFDSSTASLIKSKPEFMALESSNLIDIMHVLVYEYAMTKLKKLAKEKFKARTVRILLESEDGKFLLLKRAPHKSHPGKWDLPGGSVEFGETFLKAAIKELEEETGFEIKANKFKAVSELETGGRLRVLFHAAVKSSSKPKLDREHVKYKWVDSLDGHGKSMHPNTEKLLAKFAKKLG